MARSPYSKKTKRQSGIPIINKLSAVVLQRSLYVLTFALLGAWSLFFASAAAISGPASVDESIFYQDTNTYRHEYKLPALRAATCLRDRARAWSKVMATQGNYYHSPTVFPDITKACNVTGRAGAMSENVGYSGGCDATAYDHCAQTVFDLMVGERPPDDGHRRNILSTYPYYVGIGTYYDAQTHTVWITQDFLSCNGSCGIATYTPPVVSQTPPTNNPTPSPPVTTPPPPTPAPTTTTASLDGVKIDNSGTGQYGGNYSGLPFASATTTISCGSYYGSSTSDPFFFNGKIPASTSGTPCTIGVTPTAVSGYAVSGSTWEDGLQSYWNAQTTGYRSGSSFQVTLVAGHAYHMRWIYAKTTASSPPPPLQPPSNKLPLGHFDTASCTSLTGWGFDPDSPSVGSGSFQVYAYLNGYAFGPYGTYASRPDVDSYYHITGTHGFSGNPKTLWPYQLSTAFNNTVEIRVVDVQTGAQVSIGTKNLGACP